MPTNAKLGYGSKFSIYSGGAYVDVAEVFSITPPSYKTDVVDVTSFDSSSSFREFIGGLIDPGEASFDLNFIPGSASDTLLQSVVAARAAVSCRVTYPNGILWTFSAIPTGYTPTVPVGDRMTATVTLKITGSIVASAQSAPTNTVKPAISGTLTSGSTLTAYEGVWTGSPTYTYQWKAAGTNISGATSSTYTLTASEVGKAITVAVTGTNSAGNATATSAATANVA